MHKISTRVVCVNGKHPWISVVVSNCNMVMFWDAIASLIGYCEFGQQTCQNSSPKTVTAPTKVPQLFPRTLKCAYLWCTFVFLYKE